MSTGPTNVVAFVATQTGRCCESNPQAASPSLVCELKKTTGNEIEQRLRETSGLSSAPKAQDATYLGDKMLTSSVTFDCA